jgi:transcription elongation factor SPT5
LVTELLQISLVHTYNQPGSERDVVIAILQKTVHANTRHENILAAFSRDAIHGWVYIEARSTPSVSNILVGINGVAHYKNHQPPFFIDPIDYSDYPALLDMTLNGLPPHVTTWSWVRIKSGKYRHDLGIVTNVDDLSLESVVALLPRLHLSKKRKRRSRPPAIPFDGETIRGLFGEAAVETRGDTQIFKAELYRYGLHFAKFHITQLCSQGVNATEQELEPFRCIPEIWGFAKHTISALKIHDHIRVNGGPLAGFTGVILEIKALTASFRADDTTQVQEALLSEVRKLFALGDFVEVISGIHRGKQGFIVGLDGRSASIYCRRIGLIYSSFVELPGQEVSYSFNTQGITRSNLILGNRRFT